MMWRNWFKRKDVLHVNATELSASTQDFVLQYNTALNAYKGMQQILQAGHEALLTDDADDNIDNAIREAAIALSQVPEAKVAVLGRVVRQMWTDPKYCWYEDHAACERLSQLASDIQATRIEEARQRAERLYAPYKVSGNTQQR
jgi:hypothetical protein